MNAAATTVMFGMYLSEAQYINGYLVSEKDFLAFEQWYKATYGIELR